MMNCSNCHRTVPDDAILCPYCGYEQQTKTLGVCSRCSRTIPNDAILCPYCGKRVETQSPQPTESLSLTSPRFLQVQAILFFIWCIICTFCSLTSFFLGNRELMSSARSTRRIATPISTKEPPTATPEPVKITAPPYTEIAENLATMTEAQWNNYVDQTIGTWATNWVGWTDDVNEKTFGGYELLIDMDSPDEILSTYDISFDIPDEVALQITKDNPITFSGRITSITDIFGVGLVIRLEEAEWSTE